MPIDNRAFCVEKRHAELCGGPFIAIFKKLKCYEKMKANKQKKRGNNKHIMDKKIGFISGRPIEKGEKAIDYEHNAVRSTIQTTNDKPEDSLSSLRSIIKLRWIISIIAMVALGLTISVYLTLHHYRMMSGLPEYQSFCTISEYIDCDMVNSSSYSEFNGQPIALFGAGVYASIIGLMILSIFVRGIVIERYMNLISLIGLSSFGFSLYLAYVSVFILHAICFLCVITYFINLFIFLGGRFAIFRGREWFYAPIKTFLRPFMLGLLEDVGEARVVRIGSMAGIMVIVMVVIQGFFAALYLDAKYIGFTEKEVVDFIKKYQEITPVMVDVEGSPYWGSNKPDLTITIFEDFRCDFCKRAHVTSFPVFKEYKDKIKVVFKQLPYDKECNPDLQKTIHPGACRAAIAAACASLQGQKEFSRFQEYFFVHQNEVQPDMDIPEVAERIGGIDIAVFNKCLEKGGGEWLVRKDFNQAMELGVTRTPAYFFNGRKWEGALKPIFIRKILEVELNEKLNEKK